MKLEEIIKPLLSWYEENKRDLPWRREPTPYHVWVSEIMLQQTRVEAVKGYYERFLTALPQIEDLAACPENKLLKLWEGLGYYNRVKNMQKAAKEIVLKYGGELPADYEEILELPGIGSYTAGAIFFHCLRPEKAGRGRQCTAGPFPDHRKRGGYPEAVRKAPGGAGAGGSHARRQAGGF